MSAKYILDKQSSLFGQPDVIGFGVEGFFVMEMPRDEANALIVENHYSEKFYSASNLHLGVYTAEGVRGVLQFGPAMNPASGGSVVIGTGLREYLELNRMWLCDSLPRNSESRALSFAIKFIRRACPKVKWIQSFSDERCGLFGTVYQAAGFSYHGEHTSIFWELDGVYHHNSRMTRTDAAAGPSSRNLRANKDRAIPHEFRQFRYIKFMKPRFAKGCKYPALPYPKPNYAARLVDEQSPDCASEAQTLGAAPNNKDAA
jgi:hypothetical protein